MKLFIGKLSFSTTEADLRELFEPFAPISSCKLITDRIDGSSRGFGFVELDSAMGRDAIKKLDGTTFQGRQIAVSEAKPQEKSGSQGRGGFNGYSNRESRGSRF